MCYPDSRQMVRNVGRVGGTAPAQFTVPLVEVRVVEGLDVSTLPQLVERIENVLRLAPRHVVIDMARCPYIDAAAIDLLLDVHRRMWRADGRLSLRSPTRRLRRILAVTQVDQVLDVVPGDGTDSAAPDGACANSPAVAGHADSSPRPTPDAG